MDRPRVHFKGVDFVKEAGKSSRSSERRRKKQEFKSKKIEKTNMNNQITTFLQAACDSKEICDIVMFGKRTYPDCVGGPQSLLGSINQWIDEERVIILVQDWMDKAIRTGAYNDGLDGQVIAGGVEEEIVQKATSDQTTASRETSSDQATIHSSSCESEEAKHGSRYGSLTVPVNNRSG